MKVNIEGPIYDLTPLQPEDKYSKTNDSLNWVRIFTKRHPEEVFWTEWIGDLVSEEGHKHLLIPDKDHWKFFAHLSMFQVKQQNGKLEMFISQQSLSDKSKKDIQEQFPNQVIVVINKTKRRKVKESSVLTFGGINWEDLPISTAELSEDLIVWEKRHDLELIKVEAETKLAGAESQLAELGR